MSLKADWIFLVLYMIRPVYETLSGKQQTISEQLFILSPKTKIRRQTMNYQVEDLNQKEEPFHAMHT